MKGVHAARFAVMVVAAFDPDVVKHSVSSKSKSKAGSTQAVRRAPESESESAGAVRKGCARTAKLKSAGC